MSKKRSTGAHVGSASIMLIFAVLSLISFATLTLVNSKADYNLSNNLAERQKIYYNACHEGNAFVASVYSGYDDEEEHGIIKENIPISDNQSLNITLTHNDKIYIITQWQIVNDGDFEYDYSLPVQQK